MFLFDVSNAMEFLAKCTEMQICTTFNITDRWGAVGGQ